MRTTLPTKHSVSCFVTLEILTKPFMLKSWDDLMAAQYSVERQISADHRSWTGIENVINLPSDSACLYISYDAQNILL